MTFRTSETRRNSRILRPASSTDTTEYICPFCGRTFPYRSSSPKEKEDWTKGHIISEALGNKDWWIAVCNGCNGDCSSAFEQEFLALPEIRLERALNEHNGKQSRDKPNSTGLEVARLLPGAESFRRLNIRDGIETLDSINTPMRDLNSLKKHMPSWAEEGMLAKPSMLAYQVRLQQAFMMAVGQIFFHLGVDADRFQFVQQLRTMIQLKTEDKKSPEFEKLAAAGFEYVLLFAFKSPFEGGDGSLIPMNFEVSPKIAGISERKKMFKKVRRNVFQRREVMNGDMSHILEVKKTSHGKSPARIVFSFDLYAKPYSKTQKEIRSSGELSLPLSIEDQQLLPDGFLLRDEINLSDGKWRNLNSS